MDLEKIKADCLDTRIDSDQLFRGYCLELLERVKDAENIIKAGDLYRMNISDEYFKRWNG